MKTNNKQNTLAVIPARSNSKGFPGKNMYNLCGKPLIAWSIIAAQKASAIDRVVVTSDDVSVQDCAREYGVEVIKRPSELASDTATAVDVLCHVLVELKKTGREFDNVFYLQPTSPLRQARHIDEAMVLFKKVGADALVSVVEEDPEVLKSYIADDKGMLRPAFGDKYPNMNRQNLPQVYRPNGAMYIVKSEDFLGTKSFMGNITVPYVMVSEESVDINKPEDIILAKKFIIGELNTN